MFGHIIPQMRSAFEVSLLPVLYFQSLLICIQLSNRFSQPFIFQFNYFIIVVKLHIMVKPVCICAFNMQSIIGEHVLPVT